MTTNELPAYINNTCKGNNKLCKAARKQGRNVHVIPKTYDDRHLVLPTYHYATSEDAQNAVDDANANAPLVTCDDDLYAFRAQGIAHFIPKGFIDPSRRV